MIGLRSWLRSKFPDAVGNAKAGLAKTAVDRDTRLKVVQGKTPIGSGLSFFLSRLAQSSIGTLYRPMADLQDPRSRARKRHVAFRQRGRSCGWNIVPAKSTQVRRQRMGRRPVLAVRSMAPLRGIRRPPSATLGPTRRQSRPAEVGVLQAVARPRALRGSRRELRDRVATCRA